MTSARRLGSQTLEDALRMPDDARVELIRGTIVEKAAPTLEHALAQSAILRGLGDKFFRRPGGGNPGGWWILTELDIQLGAELFRPDICGFRRDRVPALPSGRPLKLAPDWVCEILSATNADRDRVEKLQSYFHAGVPHYWLVDPVEGTLEV